MWVSFFFIGKAIVMWHERFVIMVKSMYVI